MSSIGPQFPPHLSKRKRSPSDTTSPEQPPPSKTTRPSNDVNDSDSDDYYGPSAPKAVVGPTMPPSAPTTRPSLGPTMPPSSTNTTGANDSSDDDDTGPAPPLPSAAAAAAAAAPKRTHGPAPPPAPLAERPPHPADSASDSEDDAYGPALPSTANRGPIGPSLPPAESTGEPERLQRDDWMLLPPTASAGYQERDPTKIKSRKFASGVTATTRPKDGSSTNGIASIWTETPQEKAKRLADAVLGRGGEDQQQQQQQRQSSSGGRSGVSGIRSGRGDGKGAADGRDDRIRAVTEQTRGRSLVEQHQAAKKAGTGAKNGGDVAEEDDDPSKRAFDREKDMAVGGKITASQRKELLNRASDFGGRFSKGNYL
ncbi:unnamed protein product [Discula destructiva]